MKTIFLKSTFLLLVAGLFLVSCKDKDAVKDPDNNTAMDNANAQSFFDDMAKVTEDALSNNGGARMAANISCATVTVTVLATDSTKYILDFTGGGACNDGK